MVRSAVKSVEDFAVIVSPSMAMSSLMVTGRFGTIGVACEEAVQYCPSFATLGIKHLRFLTMLAHHTTTVFKPRQFP